MSTSSDVKVTPGSGANVGTYSITEDAETKQLQRIVINDSTGAEITKAEDSVATTGDPAIPILAVRNDSNTTRTNADGDYSNISVDLAGNQRVVGNIDNAATDAGSPVKIGGIATNGLPTAVTVAQRVNANFDLDGKLQTRHSPRALMVQQQTTITTSTAETTVLTAVSSSFLDVYGVIATNISGTGCGIIFKDATSGTERFRLWVPANDTRGFMLPSCDAHLQAAVTNNWTATCSASITSMCITMFAVKNH